MHWLLLLVLVWLVQINHDAAAVTRPWWYCFGDICNRNGTDQYCSDTYLRCFDCSDIWHRCFTDDMPWNCTNSCKEYILEQQKSVHCPVLDDIANGRQDDDKSKVSYPGDVVHYSCNPGFRLEGPRELKCVKFGHWSSPQPECIRITCPVLKDVLHGKITEFNMTFKQGPGTVLKIACLSGYRLIGSDTVTCSENGEWSSALPICLEPTCSALPALLNGVWSSELKSEFPSGGTVTLHCLGGFTMIGSPVWKCSAGIWASAMTQHDHIPVCIKESPMYTYVLTSVASVVATAIVMISYQKLSMASNRRRNTKHCQGKLLTSEADEDGSQMKNDTEPLIHGINTQYKNQVGESQINQSKENDGQKYYNHVQSYTEPPIQKSNDKNIHEDNNQVKKDNNCPIEKSGTDSILQNNTDLQQQRGSEKDKQQSNVHWKRREAIVNNEGTNKSTEIQNHVSPVNININVGNSNDQNPLRIVNHKNSKSNIKPDISDPTENTVKKQTKNDKKNTQEEITITNPPESISPFPTQVSTENEKNPTFVPPEVNKAAAYKKPCYVVQQGTIEQDVNRKLTTGGTEMHIGDHDGTTNAPNYGLPQPITVA